MTSEIQLSQSWGEMSLLVRSHLSNHLVLSWVVRHCFCASFPEDDIICYYKGVSVHFVAGGRRLNTRHDQNDSFSGEPQNRKHLKMLHIPLLIGC